MPTDEENVQYLYLVLTSSGQPSINFGEVGKALDLKPGAVSKRWSRLKASMNSDKPPGPTAYEFLWLCVKHSKREKAPDWNDIAEKCNTTAGAASKRYSRMKQAFESGAAAPTSTPKKTGANDDTPPTPSKASPTKRKRAAPKTPASEAKIEQHEEQVKAEKEESPKKKKRTPAKPRAKAVSKPKAETRAAKLERETKASVPPTEATTLIIKQQSETGTGEIIVYRDPEQSFDADEVLDADKVLDADEDGVGMQRVETWLEEQEI